MYDKRFSAFHYPVLDEDAPNYHAVIQNPMDMATLLQRVDAGKYITCKAFLEDFDLILANAKVHLQIFNEVYILYVSIYTSLPFCFIFLANPGTDPEFFLIR